MTQKKSEFNKVLNAWDILVIAFGAMIGLKKAGLSELHLVL